MAISTKFSDPARYGHAMTDDVIGLLDHLQIPRAHLVGHSMGATVAADVALRYPARTASAALLAGPFYRAGTDVSDAAAMARRHGFLELGHSLTQVVEQGVGQSQAHQQLLVGSGHAQ